MNIDTFIERWTGKPITWNGFTQCVALARQYCKEAYGYSFPGVQGAINIWDLPFKGFTKIKHEVGSGPEKGDIVIFKGNTYGHVAIALKSTRRSITSFDQNFPKGSLPRLVTHTYKNVIGYIRKNITNVTMITLQKGVVVDTHGKYNSSIGLADVMSQRKNNGETLVRAVFSDGTVWERWVPTNDLEVVKFSDKGLEKVNKKLQKDLQKEVKERELEAELRETYEKDSKTIFGMFESGIEQLDYLVKKLG